MTAHCALAGCASNAALSTATDANDFRWGFMLHPPEVAWKTDREVKRPNRGRERRENVARIALSRGLRERGPWRHGRRATMLRITQAQPDQGPVQTGDCRGAIADNIGVWELRARSIRFVAR